MKASSSPCPLDKFSIILFKRCPYLRSYIVELFHIIWHSGEVPVEWKKACIVLLYKKGNITDPANFRPITLESYPLNIFTSCIRDSLFTFVSPNRYVDNKIQKGCLPKLTGTFEHATQMTNIISTARKVC